MKARFPTFRFFTWLAALGLAVWVVSRLPFAGLSGLLAGLGVWQWLAWIALNLVVVMLFTGRWWVLGRAMALPVGFFSLLRVRQAGQVVSFVTPGPQFGGEPLQVYWLWKRYGLPGHGALLSVGLDRFYELWINFAVLLGAILLLLGAATPIVMDLAFIAVLLLGVIVAMAAVVRFLLRRPDRIEVWLGRLSSTWRHHPRLQSLDARWRQMHETMEEVFDRRRRALGLALVLSLLGWGLMVAEFWLLLTFAGVSVDLTGFLLLFVVMRLAFLLPLPGGIGSVEAALFWGFQLLALPLLAAAGLILLLRLRDGVILLTGAAVLPGLQAPRAPFVGRARA